MNFSLYNIGRQLSLDFSPTQYMQDKDFSPPIIYANGRQYVLIVPA